MTSPCVCTTIRKANRALFRFYEQSMAEAELSVVQFAILRSLERNGAMPLSRIADEQAMERTSLYRTIAPLLETGAIRLRDADRGKAKIATLTRSGIRLIRRSLPYWQAAQQAVVTQLGEEDWDRLSKVILDIPAMLDAAETPGG